MNCKKKVFEMVYYFFVAIFFVSSLQSEQTDSAYKNGDFLRFFQETAQKTYKTAYDFYMMGNAAFYLGSYQEAILLWEESARLGNFFYEINVRNNTNKAREKMYLVPIKFENFWLTLIKNGINFFIFLTFLLLLLLIIYSPVLTVFRLFIFSILFLFGIFIINYAISLDAISAIIISKSPVPMRVGPSDQYHAVCSLGLADIVVVLADDMKWSKVNYQGQIGWIPHATYMTIDSMLTSSHLLTKR